MPPLEAQHQEWITFYEKHLPALIKKSGVREQLSSVALPKIRAGFDRLIVVAPGVSASLLVPVMEKQFFCWPYHLSSIRDHTNVRAAGSAYAILVRNSLHPDEGREDLSAESLSAQEVQVITLPERLLLGLKYWDEQREYLDREPGTVTLCAGSRTPDGFVPYVWTQETPVGIHVGLGWRSPQAVGDRIRQVSL